MKVRDQFSRRPEGERLERLGGLGRKRGGGGASQRKRSNTGEERGKANSPRRTKKSEHSDKRDTPILHGVEELSPKWGTE